MRKLMLTVFFTLLFIFSVNIYGQVMPPGSSDKNLDDRNIKERSIEMDKIKRDAEKADKNKQQSDQVTELKFKEIKEDFEKLQMMQNSNIAIYTKSKQIDYAKISGNANEMSKSGMRLKVNLFAVPPETKKSKKKESKLAEETKTPEQSLPTDVKMLIVEIDNTLAAFVGNPMFTNPQVVNPAENAKAKMDLERLIKLSAALNQEADKMSKGGK